MKNKPYYMFCSRCQQAQGNKDGIPELNTLEQTLAHIKELAIDIPKQQEAIVNLVNSWDNHDIAVGVTIAKEVRFLIGMNDYLQKLYADLGRMINIAIR